MDKLIKLVICTSLCLGVVWAGSGVVWAGSPQPTNDPAVVNAVKQVELDMGEAMLRADIDRLKQIYAEDFVTVGSSGKIVTKSDILRDFQTSHDKLESYENGPMDIQVFGNVAVVHGSTSEKRIRDGKDSSGEFVWMDLLERRDGKWLVVRSAGSKVK